MTRFAGLGAGANVPAILKMSPDAGVALLQMHEAIMRGPSALTPGERELIAAYVSGRNRCDYCHGIHAATAVAYGYDAAMVESIVDDPDLDGVDARLRPILLYARKLTDTPDSVTDADAQAVYDAGWDEQALHDAIMVTCTFNFMNRLLEGHGVHGDAAMYRQRGPLLKEHGYASLIRLLRPGS